LAAGLDYVYRGNMFVIRVDLFDAYMTWWDAIMTGLAAAITPPNPMVLAATSRAPLVYW